MRIKQLLWFSVILLSAQAYGWENKARVVLGIDYYSQGNLEDNLDQDEKNFRDIVAGEGGESHPSHVTNGGAGLRVGFHVPFKSLNNWAWGFGLNYVPALNTELNVHDPTSPPGDLKSEIENTYTRGIFEIAKYFPLREGLLFRIGAGAGIGQGITIQKLSSSGYYSSWGSYGSSHRSTGFTWEVSPAVVFDLGGKNIELGLRYASFPKIEKSEETSAVEYRGLAGYIGFAF